MNDNDYGPRQCVVCGKTYLPRQKNQKSCGDPECKKEVSRMAMRRYREENYAWVMEQRRIGMRKKREAKEPKPDTIIAIGYAERQMAASLEKAGKVKTEL